MNHKLIGGRAFQGYCRGKCQSFPVRRKDTSSGNNCATISAAHLNRIIGNTGCQHRFIESDRNRKSRNNTSGIIGDRRTRYRGWYDIRHLKVDITNAECSSNRFGDAGKSVRCIGNCVGCDLEGELPGCLCLRRVDYLNKCAIADRTGGDAGKFCNAICICCRYRGSSSFTRLVFERLGGGNKSYGRFGGDRVAWICREQIHNQIHHRANISSQVATGNIQQVLAQSQSINSLPYCVDIMGDNLFAVNADR